MKWENMVSAGLLLGMCAAPVYSTLGGDCGQVAGPPELCGVGPTFDCSMWEGSPATIWENCGGPSACVADGSSPTGYSQTYQTEADQFVQVAPCNCTSFGICGCAVQFSRGSSCRGLCTVACPPPSTPCLSFSPWGNAGCAAGGCTAGQMEQTRTGNPSSCNPGSNPLTQCIADSTDCSPPSNVVLTANPLTIHLGDTVVLSWTFTGGSATSETINQGIGSVSGYSYTATPASAGSITYTITISNAIGSNSANATVTVLPPLPRCGAGNICGHVYAREKPTLALPGEIIELRTSLGNIYWTSMTDNTGTYTMSGVPAGSYWISVANGRNQFSNPTYVKTQPNNVIGVLDFQKAGRQAIVTIAGPPDSFVLVSTFSYLGAAPPSVGDGVPYLYVVSASIGLPDQTGTSNAVFRILGGQDYWFRCWTPQLLNNQYVYLPGASVHMASGATLWPMDTDSEVCP
jgi:hypothetical protein